MADISKISPDAGTTEYNVKDATARSDIASIVEKIPVNASSSNKFATEADIASAYHAAGTKTVAELLSSLLVAANEGNVYNMTDAGTTTADFIEGAGKPIRIGDNVGVCKVGNDYKFDLLSGFIDTSNFVEKSSTSGLLKNDGTVDTTSYVETVSGKGLSTNDYTDADQTALQTTIPLEISQLQGSMLTKASTSEVEQVYTDNGVLGAKNSLLIKISDVKSRNTSGTWSGNTYTLNSLSYACTVDDNGYITKITANGTPSARTDFMIADRQSYTMLSANILSGTNGGSSGTYKIQMYDSTTSTAYDDTGSGVTIPITVNGHHIGISIITYANVTMNNIEFYPMLRLSTDPNSTYAPYAMTNRELTDMMTPVEGTITVSEGVTNTEFTYIRKVGKIVNMYLAVNGVTKNQFTTFATIPQGFRPYMTLNVIGVDVSDNSTVYCTINNDGSIQSRTSISGNVRIVTSWVTP